VIDWFYQTKAIINDDVIIMAQRVLPFKYETEKKTTGMTIAKFWHKVGQEIRY
jgi:hypothetical protein